MVRILEKISGTEVKKKYLLNMPKGVRGRSSNNDKAYKVLKLIKKILIKFKLIKLVAGLGFEPRTFRL